jgi:phage protein U
MSINHTQYQMKLGDFQFAVSAASFEKLSYDSSYRWESKAAPTADVSPLMQYNGPGERSLNIEGTIYPQLVKNGLKQVEMMRAEAGKGQALPLCYIETGGSENSGVGRILGKWCIVNISEQRCIFLADGNPRMITFSMSLKAYENGIK